LCQPFFFLLVDSLLESSLVADCPVVEAELLPVAAAGAAGELAGAAAGLTAV
jgi:hypothetical protein